MHAPELGRLLMVAFNLDAPGCQAAPESWLLHRAKPVAAAATPTDATTLDRYFPTRGHKLDLGAHDNWTLKYFLSISLPENHTPFAHANDASPAVKSCRIASALSGGGFTLLLVKWSDGIPAL